MAGTSINEQVKLRRRVRAMISGAEAQLSDNERLAEEVHAPGVHLYNEYEKLTAEALQLENVRKEDLELQDNLARQIQEQTPAGKIIIGLLLRA